MGSAHQPPSVSTAFFALAALVHIYGCAIFIFFHPPRGVLSQKNRLKMAVGGAATAIAAAYFLRPAWRPTTSSAGHGGSAMRWLVASIPLLASPIVLFKSFTFLGVHPAVLLAAGILTDVDAVPLSSADLGYRRFRAGAWMGILYPSLLVLPWLLLETAEASLGVFGLMRHRDYPLAATVGSLAACSFLGIATVWRRWSAAVASGYSGGGLRGRGAGDEALPSDDTHSRLMPMRDEYSTLESKGEVPV